MRGIRFSILLCLFLCFLVFQKSKAQSFYRFNTSQWSVSMSLGSATYFGDLKEKADLDFSPSLGVGVDYKVHPRIGIRTQLIWYRIEGTDEEATDPSRVRRNLSFRADNFELNAQGVFYLFEEPMGFVKRVTDMRPFNIYALFGIGVTAVNPKAELNGTWYKLSDFDTEGVDYGSMTFVAPFGGGVRYKVNQSWALALETTYHLVFSDYFDDVSENYPNPSDLTSQLARDLSDRTPELGFPANDPGDQRGNPSSDDGYLIINLRVEYLAIASLFNGSPRGRFRGPRRYKGGRYR